MLTALDLFPREADPRLNLTIQARVLLRASFALFTVKDVHRLVEMGSLSQTDDPDQAHRIAVNGW